MTPKEITQLINSQIAAAPSLVNPHAVDLKRCLTKPSLIKVINRNVSRRNFRDTIMTVWLVLEERPDEKDDYCIVYNEENGMFGLIAEGFPDDPYPVMVGYYGDFPSTLTGM